MSERMIVNIPPEIQMAIRLRAIKNDWSTGQVVEAAIMEAYSDDVEEALDTIKQTKAKKN